jgi:hypothetical protein
MSPHSTQRSRNVARYIKFKGAVWAIMGLGVYVAAVRKPDLVDGSSLRLFAYYLLLFAVPGILIWTVGVLVRFRRRLGWYLGVAYLSAVVFGKVAGGVAEVPIQAWYWATRQVPEEYLPAVGVFGVLAAAVFAFDLAALAFFLSPRGRDCWGIGTPNPDSRG